MPCYPNIGDASPKQPATLKPRICYPRPQKKGDAGTGRIAEKQYDNTALPLFLRLWFEGKGENGAGMMGQASHPWIAWGCKEVGMIETVSAPKLPPKEIRDALFRGPFHCLPVAWRISGRGKDGHRDLPHMDQILSLPATNDS